MALATVPITVDETADLRVVERWPLFFVVLRRRCGRCPRLAHGRRRLDDHSRRGGVLHHPPVALASTSSQYGSRAIRSSWGSRRQVALGVFVGRFAYCLVALQTIHGGDEEAFAPY